MATDTMATGVAYYTALGEKNFKEVQKHLHPEIQFTDPQETVMGKEVVLEAAERFAKVFKTLKIRKIWIRASSHDYL